MKTVLPPSRRPLGRSPGARLRITALMLAVLLVPALLGGCAKSDAQTAVDPGEPISSLADLHDRALTIGMPSDYDVSDRLMELCPQGTIEYYEDLLMAVEAVSGGKLDAYVCGRNYLESAIAAGSVSGVQVLSEPVYTYYCGLGLSEQAPVENYIQRVNDCIAALESDGTLADMESRWYEQGCEEMPDIAMPQEPEATLRVVTFGKAKPYSYIKDNQVIGFDVELAYRVAAALNCDVTLETAEYPSMLMGLSAGRYDMISANLYISDERSENIRYSSAYDSADILMLVRDSSGTVEKDNLFTALKQGLRRTFADEGRWRMILSGLGTTLTITVLGFALANVIGAGFCALAMSRHRLCRAIEDAYSRIMQGMPLVVVLMILFYIVFGHSSVSGVWIAILGFGMASGASLARQFQGAISSVSSGQQEAALALGLSRLQTFFGIVLPQAVRRLLPGYFSEFIALMKGTAIVGYVAVTDLTKVSDVIRSSTYDAFFPLISVAVIYFFIAFLLLGLLKYLKKRLAPKRVGNREASQ